MAGLWFMKQSKERTFEKYVHYAQCVQIWSWYLPFYKAMSAFYVGIQGQPSSYIWPCSWKRGLLLSLELIVSVTWDFKIISILVFLGFPTILKIGKTKNWTNKPQSSDKVLSYNKNAQNKPLQFEKWKFFFKNFISKKNM